MLLNEPGPQFRAGPMKEQFHHQVERRCSGYAHPPEQGQWTLPEPEEEQNHGADRGNHGCAPQRGEQQRQPVKRRGHVGVERQQKGGLKGDPFLFQHLLRDEPNDQEREQDAQKEAQQGHRAQWPTA